MMYRKFFMTNANDDVWMLTDANFGTNENEKVFLNNPTGLGYSNSLSTNAYENALNVTSSVQNFGTIGGEFVMYADDNDTKYDDYHKFIDFLSYEPLLFNYIIPSEPSVEYWCKVAVLNIDKTEIKTDGFMRCSFSLQMLSRWHGADVSINRVANTFTLNNPGHFPVGFGISITGDLENPYFTLSQDGEIYGEAKFEDTTNFEQVYVNSGDGEQEVILQQGGSVVANPLSYQDLSISNGSIYVTFVKLARGESELKIGYDSGTLDGVVISYTPIYRSV